MSLLIERIIAERAASEDTLDLMRRATVVRVQNVARYFWSANDQEYWSFDDFPCLAPPFELFWMEYEAPPTICSEDFGTRPWPSHLPAAVGGLFFGFDVAEVVREGASNYLIEKLLSTSAPAEFRALIGSGAVRWIVCCDLQFQVRKHHYLTDAFRLVLGLDAAGLVASVDAERPAFYGSAPVDLPRDLLEQELTGCRNLANPFFLATSLMHCKNVSVEAVSHPPPVAKRRARAGLPTIRYRTVNVEAIGRVLRAANEARRSGAGAPGVHIVRGHFKDYKEGAGLFGRLHGRYFWPTLVRGSKASGVVMKGYNVEAPK